MLNHESNDGAVEDATSFFKVEGNYMLKKKFALRKMSYT